MSPSRNKILEAGEQMNECGLTQETQKAILNWLWEKPRIRDLFSQQNPPPSKKKAR